MDWILAGKIYGCGQVGNIWTSIDPGGHMVYTWTIEKYGVPVGPDGTWTSMSRIVTEKSLMWEMADRARE